MEILGDDEAALPKPPPRRWPMAQQQEQAASLGAAVDVTPTAAWNGGTQQVDPATALEPGHAAVGGQGAADGTTPEAGGRLRALVDTVAGPESLGICGVLTALAGVTSSSLSPIIVAFRPEPFGGENATPAMIAESSAMIVSVFGVLAFVLGVGGVLRLRPRSPAWARGLTGAATVLGLLLLLVAAWAIWRAGFLPGATGVTGEA